MSTETLNLLHEIWGFHVTPLLRFSEGLLKSEFCLSLSLCEMKYSGNYISLPHYHTAFEKGKEICHMEKASSAEI